MKKKVLVEGPVLSQSGYGEHARFVLRSLRSQEDVFDIYALPLNWGQTSWLFEENEERKWIDSIINKTVQYVQQQGQFDIYCHVGIPPELKRKAPITISINASIETDRVQAEWIDILNRECDKVITISEHSKNVLTNTSYKIQNQSGRVFDIKLNVPVKTVGYPTKKFKEFNDKKEWLTLDYDFNFLCVAQWGPRKNLENTIRWFVEEFKNDKVGLVCKINASNNSILDKNFCNSRLEEILKPFSDRKCKVYLVHGDMNEDEIHNLYIHPQIKAMINFGHGEGFGLPLFEAVYSGLPVITHDFGGQKDFLFMEIDGKKKKMFSNIPYDMKKIQPEAIWTCCTNSDMEWAYIKPFAAKSAMREITKDYGRFKGQAKKLQEYILENWTEQKQYEKFCGFIYKPYFLKKINKKAETIPKVTLGLTLYKGEKYIEKYMEDIVKQTIFDDIEFIIMNANSPENECKIINKYVEKYKNIKYEKLDYRATIGEAINLIVEKSSGEFIAFLDVDNFYNHETLEIFRNELLENDDIGLVYGDCIQTRQYGKTYDDIKTGYNELFEHSRKEFSKENMIKCLPGPIYMYRKSFFDLIGSFDTKYKHAMDWEYWLRAVEKDIKFKKINFISGVYYFNEEQGMSTSALFDKERKKEEAEIFFKYYHIFGENGKKYVDYFWEFMK